MMENKITALDWLGVVLLGVLLGSMFAYGLLC
jgi:hypothetical protein